MVEDNLFSVTNIFMEFQL